MKERPILFSAPMVRALLDGSKTQTRRIVKPLPNLRAPITALADVCGGFIDGNDVRFACPYGQPGDRLWVRENYRLRKMSLNGAEMDGVKPSLFTDSTRWFDADGAAPELAGKCRPSIHMPRWASRILLEVVSVRVERVQGISVDDCHAEGIGQCDGLGSNAEILDLARRMGTCIDEVLCYATLWEQINGADSWDANPWVWVVEFKRVTP